MCGRYTLTAGLEELVEVFGVTEIALAGHRPRYNVAPTQPAPVVVRSPGGRRLGEARWGLVPPWAPDPRVGARMINARSETVAELPAFREAFRRRRCLVLADGFYEWTAGGPAKGGTPGRIPHWIHRTDCRPFALAGLWERWSPRDEPEKRVHSFTILTTAANRTLRPLHDRMPVVLLPESLELWLEPGAEPAALADLLRPAPEGLLEAWPVSPQVNAAAFDDPSCIAPAAPVSGPLL